MAKFLADLLPIILFFIAYKLQGIYVATIVVILTTAIQISYAWWKHRKVDTMLWVSLGLITVLGGATLLLHDESFVKQKPTALYACFAIALLGSQLLFKRNLIKSLLGPQFSLPERIWTWLNLAWTGFFALLAVLNYWVAMNYSTDAWVNFKLFGTTGLMLLFFLAQGLSIARFIQTEEKE